MTHRTFYPNVIAQTPLLDVWEPSRRTSLVYELEAGPLHAVDAWVAGYRSFSHRSPNAGNAFPG
jgi:hypothetical protein